MLKFTQHPGKPSRRLLILHDDGQREFDYTSGALTLGSEPATLDPRNAFTKPWPH